jgi:hypothetical protein
LLNLQTVRLRGIGNCFLGSVDSDRDYLWASVAYRPLSRLSFYLDYLAFGWRAGAWHAENLILDAVAACCTFAIARELKVNRFSALLAALLFAVAPLGSDNIDWISGRTGLLCLIFMLLAVLCWIWGLRNWKWWLVAGLLYVLSMMTYEAGLILPLLLLCLAPAVVEQNITGLRRQTAFLAAMFVLGAGFWWLRFHLIGMVGTDVDGSHDSIWTAIQTNLDRVTDQFLRTWGIAGIWILAGSSFLGMLSSKTRLLAIGLLFMAGVCYLPFVMVNGVAPRFLFMMQMPLCLILTLPLVGDEGQPRFTLMLAMVGLLLVFGVTSHRQAYNSGKASNVGRQILSEIVSIESERHSNLVVEGVPDSAFGYPMMWFYFEIAVRTRLDSALPVLARSSEVLSNPSLLHAALTQPTRYFAYGIEKGTMEELTRDTWVAHHADQIRAAGQMP